MTDLTERYLNSIKPLLPGDQKEDIVAELREEIWSRVEEQQAELGRTLKTGEVDAIVKAMGSPLAVAARYGSGRSLIGPKIYPAYMLALKMSLAVIAFGQIVTAVVRTAVDFAQSELFRPATHFGEAIANFWTSALFVGGLITLVAAIIERIDPDLKFDAWKPQTLPSGPKPGRHRQESRVELAFSLAFNAAAFVWLLGFLEVPSVYPSYLSPDSWVESAGISLAAIWWRRLFGLMLLGIAAHLASDAVALIWPTSQRRRAAARLLTHATGLAFTAAVLLGGPPFKAAAAHPANAKVAEVLTAVNQASRIGFAIVGAILVLTSLVEMWRLFGPKRQPAPHQVAR